MYALAASAAGVSLLALAQPSEAKIVYTKTHYVIGKNGVYPLDLNHDQIIDFIIQQAASISYSTSLRAKAAFHNGVEGSNYLAAALKIRSVIGPRQNFINSSNSFGELMARHSCTTEGGCGTNGKWVNVNNRYLGLQFRIDGKKHYGWARLSVKLQGFNITATLTGYAYETIPQKQIHAGQVSGEGVDATASPETLARGTPAPRMHRPQPASLGELATGASGVGRKP